jgi:hypothetical protein
MVPFRSFVQNVPCFLSRASQQATVLRHACVLDPMFYAKEPEFSVARQSVVTWW